LSSTRTIQDTLPTDWGSADFSDGKGEEEHGTSELRYNPDASACTLHALGNRDPDTCTGKLGCIMKPVKYSNIFAPGIVDHNLLRILKLIPSRGVYGIRVTR
jgi:hypothetical protein